MKVSSLMENNILTCERMLYAVFLHFVNDESVVTKYSPYPY